jgi:hypothetical protein
VTSPAIVVLAPARRRHRSAEFSNGEAGLVPAGASKSILMAVSVGWRK